MHRLLAHSPWPGITLWKAQEAPSVLQPPLQLGVGWVPLCLRELETEDEMEDSNPILQGQPSIFFGGIHTKKEYGTC